MKGLYPIVGGTASAHKWNLKDPRDLDADGNWIISIEEVEQCCEDEYLLWVKELPTIEFNPKKDQL